MNKFCKYHKILFFIFLLLVIYMLSINVSSQAENNMSYERLWYVDEIIEEEIISDVGEKIPEFTFIDEKDNKKNILNFQGKIIITFWATWCSPSGEQISALEKLYQELTEEIEIITINYQEDKETVMQFVEEKGKFNNFQIIIDKEGLIAEVFSVEATPTNYFVDKEGILRIWYKGAITETDQLKTYINRTEDYRKAPLLDGEILSGPQL